MKSSEDFNDQDRKQFNRHQGRGNKSTKPTHQIRQKIAEPSHQTQDKMYNRTIHETQSVIQLVIIFGLGHQRLGHDSVDEVADKTNVIFCLFKWVSKYSQKGLYERRYYHEGEVICSFGPDYIEFGPR
jgi:hypothetical protein